MFESQPVDRASSLRMGVAYWGEKEQKGIASHGVFLARHAPHAPTPFGSGEPT